MKTILLTNQYTGAPLEIVQSVVPEGFRIQFLEEQTQEALERRAGEADYILAGGRLKITRAVLEKASRLVMIQRSGVGLDTLDLDAIREKGIPLYVNQGVNAESASEQALMLILACLRKLPTVSRRTKEGIWKKQEQGVQTAELRGKTVGVIGMGNIARKLVSLLQPFRVNILYNSRTQAEPEFEAEKGLTFVSLTELLERSDVVTVHCSLTPETRNLINRDTVAHMKEGAVLVNTARGQIVDTDAVAEALRSGKLAYAALDVHAREPIPEDYPLKEIENVILTPHIAGVTYDSFRAMMHDAFRNIALFEQGKLEEIEPHRYL